MFTGLIETTGRLVRLEPGAGGLRVRIATPVAVQLRAGDSVAVSGVCLTVTEPDDESFVADVSPETARVTTFGAMRVGRLLNIERPLRADGRLGGHFVLGHVDGVGQVVDIRPDGDCHWLDVTCPPALSPLLIAKGSIALDGISLTVAALSAHRFGIQIVPFTWTHTALAETHAGDAVNLEADVIGKYVARLMGHEREPAEMPAALARESS
jgi:riboflavin synthase